MVSENNFSCFSPSLVPGAAIVKPGFSNLLAVSFAALVLCCTLIGSVCISDHLVNGIFALCTYGKLLVLEQDKSEGEA